MDETFNIGGYDFKSILSKDHYRYWVKCLQTGDEIGSDISNDTAAGLLVDRYNFAKGRRDSMNRDSNYVQQVFEKHLLKNKMSECDNLVESNICSILGNIKKKEQADDYIIYQTSYFNVTVLFENTRWLGATKIELTTLD